MAASAPEPATELTSRAGTCPFTVDRPVMRQRWARLTFLHWPFEPEAVQRLLPAGLTAETFDGAAWVGLVPFYMHVATGGGRRAPWASDFCETNVRTYVRDSRGNSGIWFFSLDAARLGAVAVARATYRLPYYWSAMRLAERGDEVSYGCRRRWPSSEAGARSPRSRVRIRIGDRISPAQVSDRDHFLTARFILFSSSGGNSVSGPRQRLARAWHLPWPLHAAQVLRADDELIQAAGLPRPDGEPLALYSPGVDVRIGRPERLG